MKWVKIYKCIRIKTDKPRLATCLFLHHLLWHFYNLSIPILKKLFTSYTETNLPLAQIILLQLRPIQAQLCPIFV